MLRLAFFYEIDAVIDIIKGRLEWEDEMGIQHWNTVNYLNIFPRKYFEDAV